MDDRSKIFSQFLQQLHERQAPPPPVDRVSAPANIDASNSSNSLSRSEPSKANKRLILQATSKGGVGKSYVTINLIEWMESRQVPLVAFDPDWCNSTLTRFYPASEFIDISESVQLDNVIRALENSDLVIADGVGPLQTKFIDWLEDTRVFDLRDQLGLEITLILIIEEDKETVFQAGQAAKRVGNRANWLVVRNLKTSPVTEIYDNSKARKELQAVGAREITIERLPWNLNSVLQKSSKSIGSLIRDESVFFLERQRLRSYQQRLFEEFSTAQDILLPPAYIQRGMDPQTPAASHASPEEAVVPVARPRVPPEEV